MRSMNSRNRNLGIQSAQQSAKSIAGRAADRVVLASLFGAFLGIAYRTGKRLRHALRHTSTTVTRRVMPRVTSGALWRMTPQRPGQYALACCLAAR